MLVKEKHKISKISDESKVQNTMKIHIQAEVVQKEPAPMAEAGVQIKHIGSNRSTKYDADK